MKGGAYDEAPLSMPLPLGGVASPRRAGEGLRALCMPLLLLPIPAPLRGPGGEDSEDSAAARILRGGLAHVGVLVFRKRLQGCGGRVRVLGDLFEDALRVRLREAGKDVRGRVMVLGHRAS